MSSSWALLPNSPSAPPKVSPPTKRKSEKGRVTEVLWLVADLLWSCVVVAPLVVIYWRSTWDLLDELVFTVPYLHPSLQRQLSGLVCYVVGLLVRIVMDMAKFDIGRSLSGRSRTWQLVGTWMFDATFAIAGVSFWRGVWFLMQIDVGIGTPKLVLVLLGSLTVLILNKVPKSLISSPLAISLDNYQNLEVSSTFFRKTPDSGFLFFLDILFTNIVIRQMVVFCWWSLWSLENKFFYYQAMAEQSSFISYDSLLVGYAGAVFSTFLSKVIQQNLTSTSSVIGKLLSTAVTLLAFFSSVNVWRGLWSLLNVFFLPSLAAEANYLIGHLLGLVALTGLVVTSTIASDAIVVEGEAGEVVSVNYWYREVGEETKGTIGNQC